MFWVHSDLLLYKQTNFINTYDFKFMILLTTDKKNPMLNNFFSYFCGLGTNCAISEFWSLYYQSD